MKISRFKISSWFFVALSIFAGNVVYAENLSEISGSWTATENPFGKAEPMSVFDLKLHIIAGVVRGQYCYVTQYGNKIDCDPSDNENISGFISGSKARVTFFSFFGGTNGVAEITMAGGRLTWRVVKSPDGEFYGPLRATLSRSSPAKENASPSRANRRVIVDKAYFYSAPSDVSVTKAYAIKGDSVVVQEMSDDGRFIKIRYQGKKLFIRWIHCEDVDACKDVRRAPE
ncbi:hypothetical protein BJG93_36390 (plasmid) [Paraburkholderia sprentiae WSM5005]|uniref:Uncharacterized protein n=1 Tax=Paraburkholderia sprentiae WSM5005 TaxID=754502 RepID=A0A8F4KJ74_9BURK|nr:hypothetical protein [Paraburkholderia sprentiae]QXE07346.1 hypothetical protein BJG93_36390 [Paraburkholderia sprentiae WSM5005]